MHEPVTDSENRSWTQGPELGRGVWGRVWQLTGPDGARAVLKVPLGADDLGSHDPDVARELVAACRAAADHQVAWLREASDDPLASELWGTVGLDEGRTGLVLPDLGPSLGHGQRSVADALDAALAVALALNTSSRPHGQLRPTNVFVGADGSVTLSDWLTEPMGAVRATLSGSDGWNPPGASPRAEVGDDTWGLARWLATSLLGEPPPGGLDRAAIAQLRDRLVQRLLDDDALPRFVDRTADRLATLVGRAVSVESEPSPPFRFREWGPVVERLQEARSLLEPRVVDVGPLVWPAWRPDETFGADEPVAFTVRVGGSPGLEESGDVVCGLRVDALHGDEPARLPVPGAAVQVRTERGARFRFRLELPPLPAGHYRVTAAFAVEGTGATPVTAEARFAVDPAAAGQPPTPSSGPFDNDRATLVPDDLEDLGELPDPRLGGSEDPDTTSTVPLVERSIVPALDDGTLPRGMGDRPAPAPRPDRGVTWVLGLSGTLAIIAVLTYVARSC